MRRLEEYIVRNGKRLRLGYTTGSCAVGAAVAAANILLGNIVSTVWVHTPKGILLELDIEQVVQTSGQVFCTVQKDSGDDPDCTNGIFISATVSKIPTGIRIEGGKGIGRVTKPGLACKVGHAAINPGPMAAIGAALEQVCGQLGYTGGLLVTISAQDGEIIAPKTFNPRLGIVGGISILGTTGIVEPMSNGALIDTIQAELSMRRQAGEATLLLTPGNYGLDFLQHQFTLPPERAVRCSNFVGEALDYAVYLGFPQIVLVGHLGKLVKLAAGIMNTHSKIADGRMEIIAAHTALQGGSQAQIAQLLDCVSVDWANHRLKEWGLDQPVWDSIAEKIAFHLSHRVGGGVQTAFAGFLQDGMVVHSQNLHTILNQMQPGGIGDQQ